MREYLFEIIGILWVLACLGIVWIIRSKKIQNNANGALSLILFSYLAGLIFLGFILTFI